MLSLTELRELKASLPLGYFKKTIIRSGMSEKTVANFFSEKHHRYNIEVHRAALEVADEWKREKDAALKRQKDITDEKKKDK